MKNYIKILMGLMFLFFMFLLPKVYSYWVYNYGLYRGQQTQSYPWSYNYNYWNYNNSWNYNNWNWNYNHWNSNQWNRTNWNNSNWNSAKQWNHSRGYQHFSPNYHNIYRQQLNPHLRVNHGFHRDGYRPGRR